KGSSGPPPNRPPTQPRTERSDRTASPLPTAHRPSWRRWNRPELGSVAAQRPSAGRPDHGLSLWRGCKRGIELDICGGRGITPSIPSAVHGDEPVSVRRPDHLAGGVSVAR